MRRSTSAGPRSRGHVGLTSGVASSWRTEWWAGPGDIGPACGAWSGRARAIRLLVPPPAVWSDECEDGAS
jgi:hypothetical protein